MKPQFVVAIGDAFDGLTLYGPFNSNEEAINWADDGSWDMNWNVVRLNPVPDKSE